MRKSPWISPAWMLLGLGLLSVPFYRVLYFTDRTLFFRDLIRDLLVQKVIWANSFRAGNGIPFWNHFSLGGVPFYSMIVGSPLNPLNLLFLLFPQNEAAKALSYYLWLHYVLFWLGCFLYLRLRRCPDFLALLLSVSLSLSGYLLSLHSLGHMLAASVAIPWYFYFQQKYFHSPKTTTLMGMSACLAWPIYGGDPQFTYMLAFLALYFFLFQKRCKDFILLGAFSVAAAAAQMLPALIDILRSQRLQIDTEELLLFSFHPIRFAETFYPLFFGNRFGATEYWGGDFINFPYKHPFIFSTYPGVLTLLAFFSLPLFVRHFWKSRQWRVLLLALPLGFLLCLGVFSPLPLFEILAKVLPFFALFRYPERLLFWPLLGVFFLTAAIWRRIWKRPALLFRPMALALPALFLLGSLTLWTLDAHDLLYLPDPALAAVQTSLIFVSVAYFGLWLALRFSQKIGLGIFLFLLLLSDLVMNHTLLVWDQSKYLADGHRYRLANLLKADLQERHKEIQAGAAFRMGSEQLEHFLFQNPKMDHTTHTTFNALDKLLPNTAALVGVEDIAGYYSFIPQDKIKFWDAVVRKDPHGFTDIRFYLDIFGAYYVPQRDEDQQIQLTKNISAQPYLHAPRMVFLAKEVESSLKLLRHRDFQSNHDAIFTDPGFSGTAPAILPQESRRETFSILKRNGREIAFSYTCPQPIPERFLVLNESYDPFWKAYVDGKAVPVQRVNGWSMGLHLKDLEKKTLQISFRYENPAITLGAILTLLWFFLWVFFCKPWATKNTQEHSTCISR